MMTSPVYGCQPASDEAADCQPVFVVGMNGSGTSMMLDCLGRHPDLYAVPQETVMMPFIIGRGSRFQDLSDDKNFLAYWQYALDHLPALRRVVAGVVPDEPTIPDWWSAQPRTIAGVFDGIFKGLAAKHEKIRWCEKTPDHVQHLPMLSQVFSAARFVHMIRDGREVVYSLTRRQQRHRELVMYRWKKVVQLGREEGTRLGDRYLEVVYEDLTRDPKKQMTRLCDFLQLEFDERVLQSRMPQSPERTRLARGELGTISQNPPKWPQHFDLETVGKLERIGGRLLHDLGYEVDNAEGDYDPGWVRQKYWRGVDFLRETNDRRKRSKQYDSWQKIVKNVRFSLREYRSKRY